MMVLVQSSFHTTWASLFEMELEPNLLDWNVNELECELELEDMKRTIISELGGVHSTYICSFSVK